MLGLFLIIGYSNKYKYHKSLLFAAFCAALTAEPNFLIFRKTCPDCLDNGLCESLENQKLDMYWLSRIIAIIHPKYTKSVFFARSYDFGQIVLKSMTERDLLSTNSSKYKSSKNITESIIQDNIFVSDDNIQNVIFCPNIKSVHKLFSTIDEDLVKLANTKHLWLDIPKSIEPILLKFLSQVPNLNVPKFYGACGDLIFTEFKGKPLNNYFNSNWKQRMFLSFQLLEMADTLTFFHPSLIFYLTDISADNIVVNSSGIISLIDLDNVIISERIGCQNYLLINDIHVSKVIDPVKMSVSPSEICEHALSDHNYYAVCKYILLDTGAEHSGLLNDMPKEVLEKSPDFFSLLKECGTPTIFPNRISAGKHLKETMGEMIVNFGWNKSF